jgi:hypothetical protein
MAGGGERPTRSSFRPGVPLQPVINWFGEMAGLGVSMDRISVTDAVRRWATPVVAAAPLTAAAVHHDSSALVIGLSALGALAGAAAAIVQHLLSETMRHAQKVQQEHNQHHEAMFREGNQHAEVMLMLDATAPAVDVVEAARAVRDVRDTASPDAMPLSVS